ncbi:hypothetical protein GHT06_017577 [Daphnia sinensis]|uniref:Uncharacterized protein n=1 Tax=Daphnia sinensis TaxID=1820382 RepID=A0AAD5LHF1_9CRUS|nr:hypothetical protein GHT06_017577 [Daphnia sinensis]
MICYSGFTVTGKRILCARLYKFFLIFILKIMLLHRRRLGCDANSKKIGNCITMSASQREMAACGKDGYVRECPSGRLLVRQIKSSGTAVLGVIALEEVDVLAEGARVLRLHNIPLMVATPRATESEAASLLLYAPDDPAVFTQPDNVFSAVPNIARATIAVAKGIQSNPFAFCLGDVLALDPDGATTRSQLKVNWRLGCVAGVVSPQIAAQWALDLSSSAFLVEPHLLELAGLADYMRRHGVIHHPFDNELPHIVQAVSALGTAFHLQELSSCVQQQSDNGTDEENNSTTEFECSPAFAADRTRVPSQMLTFSAELEGTSNHFTPSGRLVTNRYLIQKLMAGSGESSPVAFCGDDGLVLAAIITSSLRGRSEIISILNRNSSANLLVTITALNVSSLKHIRQQHREAQLTLIATLTSAALMLRWTLVVSMADEKYRDAAIAGLIVLLASSVRSVFIPRMVQKCGQRRQLSTKSTYACYISTASGIPTSPWLDYNFAITTYNSNNCNSGNCTNSYSSYKNRSSDNSKNLTNDVKLSGRRLTRHPQ